MHRSLQDHFAMPGRGTGLVVTAFTVIELLVVLTIIGVLVSMLLPALRQARWKSTDVACVANQRQTLVSMRVYANDFHELPWNGTSAVDIVLPSSEVGTFAPHWAGAEGFQPYWRRWLRELEYAPDFRVLGCAASAPVTASWQLVSASDNGYDTFADRRDAPPFHYVGAGTDPLRAWTYGFDAVRVWGGDNLRTRRGRTMRHEASYPLLYDIRYRLYGDGTGFRITLHRQYDSYFNSGEPHWYDRWVDGTLGWTDGHAQVITEWVRAGADPVDVNYGLETW